MIIPNNDNDYINSYINDYINWFAFF